MLSEVKRSWEKPAYNPKRLPLSRTSLDRTRHETGRDLQTASKIALQRYRVSLAYDIAAVGF